MTYLESLQSLCRKLNLSYDDINNNALFSLDDLKEWINFGLLRAWDFAKWPFTAGSKTFTLDAGMITDGYIDYPEDIQDGSASLIIIGGKEFKKLDYQDFLKYKEDYPSGTKRYCGEYKRYIFFNTLSEYAVAGNIGDIYGKLKATQMINSGDLLPFSTDSDNVEFSGNQAIILLAYSEALGSEKMKNPAQAKAEEKTAMTILSILWKPFAEDKATRQSIRPRFNVPNFFWKYKKQ